MVKIVFWVGRCWPFYGSSTTFCATSLGHFNPNLSKKKKPSHEKILIMNWEFCPHPDPILMENIHHFCPSRSSWVRKAASGSRSHFKKFMYNTHSQRKLKQKARSKYDSQNSETSLLQEVEADRFQSIPVFLKALQIVLGSTFSSGPFPHLSVNDADKRVSISKTTKKVLISPKKVPFSPQVPSSSTSFLENPI